MTEGACRRARRGAGLLLLATMLGWLVSGARAAATCAGDCDEDGQVSVAEVIRAGGIALGQRPLVACGQADRDDDGVVTIDELVSAVRAATEGCPLPPTATPSRTASPSATPSSTRTSTPSRTPMATASSTSTPTFGVLGTRRFTVDSQASSFTFVTKQGSLPLVGFSGFLDLTAGQPDPVTGEALIAVTGASPYLVVDVNPSIPFAVCLRPVVPAPAAGVVACTGGRDLGVRTAQTHRVGVVGVGGFTEAECAAAGGQVESDAMPHPGVCDGPLQFEASTPSDSGAGAVSFVPDAGRGVTGLPVEVTVESAAPCGDEGPGVLTYLRLTSGRAAAEIRDAEAVPGAVLAHAEQGENLSCAAWTTTDGPGRLVAALPALHGFNGSDLISVFAFQD